MTRVLTAAYRPLMILFLCALGTVCIAKDVRFFVKWSNDEMAFDSVYSKDAVYFTSKGSSQVGIHTRSPRKRTGSICCHDGIYTNEFFLQSGSGDHRLLQINKGKDGLGKPFASTYSVEGKPLAGPRSIPPFHKKLITITRSKKYFAILNGQSVEVFDFNLNIIKKYIIAAELKEVELVALSNKAGSLLVKGSESLIFIDLNTGTESYVDSCRIPKGSQSRLAAYEATLNKFFITSDSGKSCIIENGEAIEFKVDVPDGPRDVYATDEIIIVLTKDSIYTFDVNNYLNTGLFELKPYYENEFGKDPTVRPFFSLNEFDYSKSTLYFSGGGNSGTFFEIQLIKP